MEIIRKSTPAMEPETKYHPSADPAEEKPQKQAKRNPRLVIGSLDFFDLLMEQDEQQ